VDSQYLDLFPPPGITCFPHPGALQTDPSGNKAEHLLGKLYSLIRIPPPRNHATTPYDFYRKLLFDFLKDPSRCGKLYVDGNEMELFTWNAFVRACASEFFLLCSYLFFMIQYCDIERAGDTQLKYQELFLKFLVNIPAQLILTEGMGHPKALSTPASADWWVSLAVARKAAKSLWEMFKDVHKPVRAVLILTKPYTETRVSFISYP
jgi:hypothetical protein